LSNNAQTTKQVKSHTTVHLNKIMNIILKSQNDISISSLSFRLRVTKRTIAQAIGAAFLLLFSSGLVLAQDFGLGNLTIDRPSVDGFGVELELTGAQGDPPYDAISTIEYKLSGTSTWKFGPDLVRVRPDLGTELSRNEAFAGAIWGLKPGSSYDVRISVILPGAGSQTVTSSVTTRSLAPETNAQPADYVLDSATAPSQAEIQQVLDAASPGEIIEFRGKHSVSALYLNNAGEAGNPIYIRGDGSAIIGDGSSSGIFTVLNDHWVVEDLIVDSSTGSGYAVRIDGRVGRPVTGFTLRRCTVLGRRGITAMEGSSSEIYDLTIHDNTLVGRWPWSDIVVLANGGTAQGTTGLKSTWNDTGMRLTGQGHSVFHNSISGFGDGIKTDRRTSIKNVSIFYIRNKFLWGGDDGIELDDAFRNVVAAENLILNTGTGGSKQPNNVTGGPNYFVQNVLVNQFLRPFKLNDGPNGLRIIHNTIVESRGSKGGFLWLQHNNGRVENIDVLNNLFVWTNYRSGDRLIKFDANLTEERWDGNAYWPDGEFEFGQFGSRSTSFSVAQGRADYPHGYNGANFESNGELLNAQPFEAGISVFGETWSTFVPDFDPRLATTSSATDGAIILNGFDIGARGAVGDNGNPLIPYGARTLSDASRRPNAPTGLSIEQ